MIRIIIIASFILSSSYPSHANPTPASEPIVEQKTDRPNLAKPPETTLFWPLFASGVFSASLLTGGAFAWWLNRPTQAFSFGPVTFFTQDGYAGSSDIMGHMWSNYFLTRVMTNVYKFTGVSDKNAIFLAGLINFILFTTVEIYDGFTPHRFEVQDFIFNNIGMGLGLLAEIYPEFDEQFRMRAAYYPSKAFVEKGARNKVDFVNDYDGWAFYADYIPPFFRYLYTGINWSTVGYSPSNDVKERFLGIHTGVNLSEFIHVFGWSDNIVAKVFMEIDKYFVLPFTVVEYKYGLNSGDARLALGMNAYLFYSF
jgi:hypothetical protein